MSDVIPTGATPDSAFLFDRMTRAVLEAVGPLAGRRVLDVASGAGQDALALAAAGARVVAAEPSRRMSAMARWVASERGGPGAPPVWVRSWADGLPFADGSFDAALCKGALDHFDRPEEAIAEMARVTRPGGRVVLAVANFESLSCRLLRARDSLREARRGLPRRGRQLYDAPSDHFTRYEPELVREQADRFLEVGDVLGVSLGWGAPGWSRATARLPRPAAGAALRALDGLARRRPDWSDVLVVWGTPRLAA